MQAGPARTINNGDWEGGCAAAVFTAGQFGRSYEFAVQAAVAAGAIYAGGRSVPQSGTLNKDPSRAGDGSIHYYGGVWNTAHNRWDGHVTFQYQGREYMASSSAAIQYGHHLGSSTHAEYAAAKGLPYLGHSPYFGNQLFAGVTPASLDQTGLGNSQEDDMKLITHPNGQPALVGEATFIQIAASTMTDLEAIWGPHVAVSADAWTFQSQRSLETRAALSAGSPTAANDATPELVAALKDPTVLSALAAAIKFPTKGTVELA